MSELSPIKQKILLSLFSGVVLGCSYTPQMQLKAVKGFLKEWKRIDRKKLDSEIRALYRSSLVRLKENPNKTFAMILSEKGKLRALHYHFADTKMTGKKWDGKWRMVVFDIPEKLRKGRDALRSKLRQLGFYELQKSVFVFPHACKDEVDFLIEFFGLRRYVRYGVLEFIDNDLHLKKVFHL